MRNISVGTPVTIREITIIPLEVVNIYHNQKKGILSAYIYKEPVGIVISTPHGTEAFDIDGRQVPLENYTWEIPGLQQILENL